MEEYF